MRYVNKRRLALAFYVILTMLFSAFLPMIAEVYGQNYAADETDLSFDNAQIIDIPMTKEGKGSHITEPNEPEPAGFSIMSSSLQGPVTMNRQIYDASGWESIGFDYMGEVPVIIYTYDEDFINAYKATSEENVSFSITMSDGTTEITHFANMHVYEDLDEEDEVYGIRIMAIPDGTFEAGAYTISLKVDLDSVEYTFNEIEQEYYYNDFAYKNTIYMSNHSVWQNIVIDGLGRFFEGEYGSSYYRIDVTDGEGKIYFTNYNGRYRSSLYERGDDTTYDVFDNAKFLNYTISSNLYMVNAVTTEANKYSLMVYDDKDSELLPAPIKVQFTETPVINSVFTLIEDPIVEGDKGFDFNISGFNIRNKEDIELQLIDKNEEVIAESADSGYRDYIDATRLSEIAYHMEVLSGKMLKRNEEYSVRISNSGPNLINQAETATFYTMDSPKIMNIDTSEASSEGIIIADVVNIDAGEVIKGILKDNVRKTNLQEAIATCSANGQLVFTFPQPIEQSSYKYYELCICKGYDVLCISDEFRVYEKQPEEVRAYLDYPMHIPVNITEFDFRIRVENAFFIKDLIEVELLDGEGNAAGEADKSAIALEGANYIYSYNVPYIFLRGKMLIKAGTALEKGNYTIRLKYDSEEIDFPSNENTIEVTDEPRVGSFWIEEAVWHELRGDFDSELLVSSNTKTLNVYLDDIFNISDTAKLKVEIFDMEGKVADAAVFDIYDDAPIKYGEAAFDIENLPDGYYFIVVSYDEQTIGDQDFKITGETYFDVSYPNYILSPGEGEIVLELFDAINVDPSKIKAEATDLNGNNYGLTVKIDEVEGSYNYMRIPLSYNLDERFYEVEIGYDESGDPLYSDNLIVSENPMIADTFHYKGGIEDTGEFRIFTVNYDLNANYITDIYKRDYSAVKEEPLKSINIGKPDRLGILKIDKSLIMDLPVEEYFVYVHKLDGTIMGTTIMIKYEIPSAVPDDGTPEVSINNGDTCTTTENVKLYINAKGYSFVKIANSEEALGTAEYRVVSPVIDWSLDRGDGLKHVYLKFKADDAKESETVAVSILLDTATPNPPTNADIKGKLEEEGYVELFAVGVDKAVKAYADLYGGGEKIDTIALGYIRYDNEALVHEFSSWIKLTGRYADIDKAEFYFESFAGNKSDRVEKAIFVNKLAKVSGTIRQDGDIVKYHHILLKKKVGETEYKDYKGVYSDEKGKFSFDRVPNGDYRLFSYAPRGYMDANIDVKVENYSAVNQDVVFAYKYTEIGNLTVTAADKEGNGIENAYLCISNLDTGEYLRQVTDGSGTVNFIDIKTTDEGIKYNLIVSYKAYYEYKEVTINSGDNEIRLEIPAGTGVIKGRVTAKDGSALKDIDVCAIGIKGSYGGARTNSNGDYSIEVLKGYDIYTVYVYSGNLNLTPTKKYINITPDDGDTDFVLYEKLSVTGVIKGSDGEDIKTNIEVSGGDTWSQNSTKSGANGVFRLEEAIGAGRYEFYVRGIPGYYSNRIERTITEEEIIAGGTIDLGNITIDSMDRNIFRGEYNNIRTDVSCTQKGKNITARVNYHNTNGIDYDNVTIKASIPEGTSLVAGSGSLEKEINKLKAGEKGEMTFILKAGEDFDGSKVTIKASGICNGKESPIGYADVDIVSATINAPIEVKVNTPFKIYGEATIGSEISIIAKNNNGTEEVIAFTKPNGRWYYADIKEGFAAGEYELYAKVTKGDDTGFSDHIDISVKADAITIEDIIVTSSGGQKIGINKVTGLPAFTAWTNLWLEGRSIRVEVAFLQSCVQGHFEFAGKRFEGEDVNGYKKADIKGWSSSGGTESIYFVTEGGKRFKLAEIIVLIDPSGYIYDKYTGERIKGATVTCETKNTEGSWVKWDADIYGQVNPQLTDDEGAYGWMVPSGEYRVKVQKDGYEAYVTTDDEDAKLKNIVIPPPRMDVNIGLTDISDPEVDHTVPVNGREMGIDEPITAVFTKQMDKDTITADTFKVTDEGGNAVNGAISFMDNDTKAVFTPTSPLKNNDTYNVLLSGIKDKKDRSNTSRELQRFAFSFTAKENFKTEYLKITRIVPEDKAINVSINTQIEVTFDREIDKKSMNSKNIKLSTVIGALTGASFTAIGSKLTIIPEDDLSAGTQYNVTIKSGVRSSGELYLDKDYIYTFTTKDDAADDGGDPGDTGDKGGSGDSGRGSDSSTIPAAETDPIKAKIDEALKKGLKQVILEVSGDGSLELSREIIDKLIDKNIDIIIKNGDLEAKINLASLKSELQGQSKITVIFREKDYSKDHTGYTVVKALEFKIIAGNKEIKPFKKTAIEINLGALPKAVKNRLKAGIYIKQEDKLVYIYGSNVSNKGVVRFKCDSFGEFVIAEYSKKFGDMDKYAWAEEFVDILAARGITTGISESSFNPGGTVTRAQFAAFIVRALGLEAKSSTNPFNDVKEGQWFTEAIIAAAESGIIQGYGKGSFMPDQTVTREQMAVMIMRAYELMMGKYDTEAADFEDMEDVSSYARTGVSAAKALGIISGTGSGSFEPKGIAVRAAAAKMIVKLIELVME